MPNEGHQGGHENRLVLEIIVNGQPTELEANLNAPLHTVIALALSQTGNAGQPPENWELRDMAGVLLGLEKKIEEFQFPPNARLFLNLKAGIGG